MAVTPTPIFPQAPLSVPTQLNNSTSTSVQTLLLAAQTIGALVEAIMVASSDTSARDLNLFLKVSSTYYFIGCVSIPATAGFVDTVPAVNLLAALSAGASLIPLPKDANGNPYLLLDANTSLYVMPGATITSAKLINIAVIGGSF